jgi:hypothetical protein
MADLADIRIGIDVETGDVAKAVQMFESFKRKTAQLKLEVNKGNITNKAYNRSVQQMATRLGQVTGNTNQARSAMMKYQYAIKDATDEQLRFTTASGKGMRRMEILAQQAGYQIGDLAVQIQSGTNAAVALGQQGSQLLGFFGPTGAIAGAVLAISTGLIAPFLKAKDTIKDTTKELESLRLQIDLIKFGFKDEKSYQLVVDIETSRKMIEGFKEGIRALKVVPSDISAIQVVKFQEAIAYRQELIQTAEDELKIRTDLSTEYMVQEDRVKKLGSLHDDLVSAAKAYFETNEETTESTEKANEALEKQKDFVAKLKGEAAFSASLYGKTADQIKEINDRLKFENELLKAGIKHGSYMYAKAVQYYQQARQNTEATQEFANKLKDAAKAQERLSNFETNLETQIAKVTAEIEALKKGEDASVASFIAGEKLKAEALYETAKALYTQTGQIELLAEAALQYMEVMENLTILENKRKELLTLKGTGTSTGSKRESMASIIEGMKEQANLQRKLVGLSDQEADYLQILYNLKEQNKTASGKMTEAELIRSAKSIAAINAETDALEKSSETTQGLAETIGTSFGDAFLSIIEGTESAKDAFRLMAQDIIRQLYQMLVVEQMVESIGQSLKGSGSTAGNFIGDLLSGLANNEGGGYTGSGPRAGGLDGKGGFLAMLHPKETVIDHHRGQSGGQPVQVVYNFQGGVTEADLGRALPMLVQRTKREVVDAVQRGGNVARVFR